MSAKSVSKAARMPKASAAAKPTSLRLYRVWRHTAGDESAHEIVVIASSSTDAECKAKAHVKSTNRGKGKRPQALSQSLTSILSVKAVRDKYCLEISTVPLAAIQAIPKKSVKAALRSVVQRNAEKAAGAQTSTARRPKQSNLIPSR